MLGPSTRAKEAITLQPFFDEMRALGWIEGQNIVYDHAYADDVSAALAVQAAALVARKPELIQAPPAPPLRPSPSSLPPAPIRWAPAW